MAKHSDVEYVYNYGNAFEYRKAVVEIHVEESGMLLNIIPDSMMDEDELEVMLKGFQSDVLSQMRITIEKDSAVEISFGGKKYGVELEHGVTAVKRIVPA